MASIRSAAVLGAGVMGSAIAAHLANAGIRVLLLDMVPREPLPEERDRGLDLSHPEVRNRLARAGIRSALDASPAAFADASRAAWVEPGNFEDHLDRLHDVDWVVEAVVERLDVKRQLFGKVATRLREQALLTTNTSGLSVDELALVLPEDLRPRFFGSHFFNPPRYMHLLELVPHEATDPELLQRFARFAEERLGKGVVYAKDTPNFIANRIGVFSMFYTLQAMQAHELGVEEVDAVTGKALGRPKSATFRTADLVGLDVLVHVAHTQYEGAPEDEQRAVLAPPAWLTDLVEAGRTGQKAGAGFYKKEKRDGEKQILALDIESGEYRPRAKPKFPILGQLKEVTDPGERVATLVRDQGPAGRFAWDVVAHTLLYAAQRIPEVADDVANVDRAMRWGFGWELGPFELWDAIGVPEAVARMKEDGLSIPAAVRDLVASDTPQFYVRQDDAMLAWDFVERQHRSLPERPKVVVLSDLKRTRGTLYQNPEASLVDLGDGVACLEFHSKMNAIGAGIIQAIQAALGEAGNAFQTLVLGNQGENFSVGANLMLVLFEALEGNFPELHAMVRGFQNATMALKYAPVPVVAAPFGRVLGGGTEVCLHCHRMQASHETYMGLVEVGVGLIPAGGGSKEMLLRAMEHHPEGTGADPLPQVRRVFETLGMAKVSYSAEQARGLGFLRPGDSVSMNPEHLIADAKRAALDLLETGWQPLPRPAKVRVLGRDGLANIRSMLHNMASGGQISAHDAVVGERLGWVLCGGEVDAGSEVTEDYLLDLERRAFVELCAKRPTLERIQHILKTGKPLRN